MNNNYYENIEVSNRETLYLMVKIIFLLISLQIIRILSKQIAFYFFGYSELNNISISIVIISLFTLLILYKSKKENVDLQVFSYMKSSDSKSYYAVVTFCILMLIIISFSFNHRFTIKNIMSLIYSFMIIPIYEEIIFRSYIWETLKKDDGDEAKIYMITTILSSLFQIGYIDTISLALNMKSVIIIMFIKCLLMLGYSFLIGFFKYKIKNTYSCILVHSFITILINK